MESNNNETKANSNDINSSPDEFPDPEESEFGALTSFEFTSASYISFVDPIFSCNIVVDQPTYVETSVMEASQNVHTLNYPRFKKYGYYIGDKYYAMVKKGVTRHRVKCLYRRGTPKLETIKEEPEKEDVNQIAIEKNNKGNCNMK